MTTTDRATETMAATTAAIVAAIEDGTADPAEWTAPWHHADPAAMLPTNAVTENRYSGGNRLALYMLAACAGTSSRWATYKQWQSIDAQVRKGESSTLILRPMTAKRTDADGNDVYRMFGMRAYGVFHAGQVDGYEEPAPTPRAELELEDRADVVAAFQWAAAAGARVEESPTAGASYSPQLDRVMMPDRDRFTDGHGAWSTIAHELTHWTGHDTRLARDLSGRFGDDAYAAEELVAELGAAFTLAGIGRSSEPRPDHARYLASWLRVLRSAPDALYKMATHAEKASAYLAERTLERSAA